jgi:hypothetical protein
LLYFAANCFNLSLYMLHKKKSHLPLCRSCCKQDGPSVVLSLSSADRWHWSAGIKSIFLFIRLMTLHASLRLITTLTAACSRPCVAVAYINDTQFKITRIHANWIHYKFVLKCVTHIINFTRYSKDGCRLGFYAVWSDSSTSETSVN